MIYSHGLECYEQQMPTRSERPARDYSTFSESARDYVGCRKEEFDWWCGTAEGRKAYREIENRNKSCNDRLVLGPSKRLNQLFPADFTRGIF